MELRRIMVQLGVEVLFEVVKKNDLVVLQKVWGLVVPL
jgi:hypothetical protein